MAVTIDKIWVYRYQLQSAAPLNSRTARCVYDGFLIRLENGGVGCVHPWPELGDRPVEDQLAQLKTGATTANLRQAIRCAQIDGEARQKRQRLMVHTEQPRNHWLYQQGDTADVVAEQGFDTIKFKLGLGMDLPFDEFSGFKLRLDANESYSYTEIKHWWQSLSGAVKDQIEMVEDPCRWEAGEWSYLKELGMPLAVDRSASSDSCPSPWRVIKPAVDSVELAQGGARRLVFTSYMDHPIGQLWAAWNASGCTETCGLLTQKCFAENAFSERLSVDRTRLVAPEGTGLGYDDLLETLPWQRWI